MQPDADKIEKYLELLQGSSVFEKSIDFLERKRDDDDLTWDQLKAEIHKQCRNIDLKEKGQNLKVSQVKTRVDEEEIELVVLETCDILLLL